MPAPRECERKQAREHKTPADSLRKRLWRGSTGELKKDGADAPGQHGGEMPGETQGIARESGAAEQFGQIPPEQPDKNVALAKDRVGKAKERDEQSGNLQHPVSRLPLPDLGGGGRNSIILAEPTRQHRPQRRPATYSGERPSP